MPAGLGIADDPVVGHKTFLSKEGGFRHLPLLQSEADAILKKCDEEDARRKELMPDESTAIRMMFDAWLRLKQLGWKEAIYCPKDGSVFDAIEPGSTGIHHCNYQGEWPNGSWWTHSEDDVFPSHPVLFKVPQEPKTP